MMSHDDKTVLKLKEVPPIDCTIHRHLSPVEPVRYAGEAAAPLVSTVLWTRCAKQYLSSPYQSLSALLDLLGS